MFLLNQSFPTRPNYSIFGALKYLGLNLRALWSTPSYSVPVASYLGVYFLVAGRGFPNVLPVLLRQLSVERSNFDSMFSWLCDCFTWPWLPRRCIDFLLIIYGESFSRRCWTENDQCSCYARNYCASWLPVRWPVNKTKILNRQVSRLICPQIRFMPSPKLLIIIVMWAAVLTHFLFLSNCYGKFRPCLQGSLKPFYGPLESW